MKINRYVISISMYLLGANILFAQCTTSQPISTSRLSTGTIIIDTSNLSSIATVDGIASAQSQVNQAVSDLNSVLSSNNLGYTLTTNTSLSGTSGTSTLTMGVSTETDSSNSAEEISLPAGGYSTYGEVTIKINNSSTTGVKFFSSGSSGYGTIFYKFGIHEMLHALGLANINATSPQNIMNGFNSTNDANNSLGDPSSINNLVENCITSAITTAKSTITTDASATSSGGGDSTSSGSSDGGGTLTCEYISGYDEWNDETNTLTNYPAQTICDY